MYPFSLKGSSPPHFLQPNSQPLFPGFVKLPGKGDSGRQWYGLGEKNSQYCVPGTFYLLTPWEIFCPNRSKLLNIHTLTSAIPTFCPFQVSWKIASCVIILETQLKKMTLNIFIMKLYVRTSLVVQC